MEPYVFCENCGEKTSANFSYCRKCGAKLPVVRKTSQSAQKTDLPQDIPERTAIDSTRLLASESTEYNYKEEEREIVTELEQLCDSPLAGRIIALLLKLEKLPSLSPRTHGVVGYYKTHNNEEVRITAKRILVQRFKEEFPLINLDVEKKLKAIESRRERSSSSKSLADYFEISLRDFKPYFFGFWLILSLLAWIYILVSQEPLHVPFLDLTFNYWTTLNNLDSNNTILFLFGIIFTVLSSIIIAILFGLVVAVVGALIIAIIVFGKPSDD